MHFGRVEGLVEPVETERGTVLRLTVSLDTGNAVRLVREAIVPLLPAATGTAGLNWQADQYTQETIGVDLANQGWEVIGAGELPVDEAGGIARSATYVVRLVGGQGSR